MNHEFDNNKLNKVRDLYCFASFTGLRYSDLISLQHVHIKGKILTKTQVKTRQVNSIPLNVFALEILKRNEG
jgi:integrase